MLFRRFESLIDVFKPSPDVAPPAGMLHFYAHYLKQVWPLMIAVLVIGFFAALIEVALFSFLGQLIDMAQTTTDARTFFAEHRNDLLWMALKRWQCWVLWIVVDVLYVGFFLYQDYWLTAGLYGLFILLAVMGLREWRQARLAVQ